MFQKKYPAVARKYLPSNGFVCQGEKSITRGMPKKKERNRLTQTKSTIVPSRVCSRAEPLQKIGPHSVICRNTGESPPTFTLAKLM